MKKETLEESVSSTVQLQVLTDSRPTLADRQRTALPSVAGGNSQQWQQPFAAFPDQLV
jgi:hypothetical protein